MAMKLLPRGDHGNTFTDRPMKAGEGSNGFQIDCGRFAVLPLLEFVGNLLVLVENAESGAFHRRDVHEHVLGLVVRLNEAKTLARVEPFHGADRHGCSKYEVAPHRSARGIKLSVGETRIDAARKGCRGLTQVEFDPASIARTQAKRVGVGGGNENGQSTPRPSSPKSRLVFRCRAPTGRSSAASRIAGCSRSRAISRTSAA